MLALGFSALVPQPLLSLPWQCKHACSYEGLASALSTDNCSGTCVLRPVLILLFLLYPDTSLQKFQQIGSAPAFWLTLARAEQEGGVAYETLGHFGSTNLSLGCTCSGLQYPISKLNSLSLFRAVLGWNGGSAPLLTGIFTSCYFQQYEWWGPKPTGTQICATS